MQYPELTLNLEKFMAAIVALLFAAVSMMLILLYSNSTNVFATSFDMSSVIAREEVKN